jgi:phage recombination protein Bet
MNAIVKHLPQAGKSVLVRMADRFGVDPDKMLATLKATAFRGDVTNEQMMALLVVADQYELNPWTKEIFAFPDRNNGIVPVVGVDGWARIINSHPQFDGMEFEEGEANPKGIPQWIKCTIHRKDRAHPISTKEYFEEVYRDVGPWKSHPRRMLRHKATIQCARLAFGFVGVYDQDEAERIIEAPVHINVRPELSTDDVSMRDKHVSALTDILNADKDEMDISRMLNDYCYEYLNPFPEMYLAVTDQLKKLGVIQSKAAFARWRDLSRNAKPDEPG